MIRLMLVMLFCGLAASSWANDEERLKIERQNQYKEFVLTPGMVYKIFVKKGDGCTTITFPSKISKIAGVNVSLDSSESNKGFGGATPSTSSFIMGAKPGSYYFNVTALKADAHGTLTVVYQRKTYILYLTTDPEVGYAAVNFINAGSKTMNIAAGRSFKVSPARLLSLIDMTKAYDLIADKYPNDLRDAIRNKNKSIYRYANFNIELLETVRWNTEDTLVFKILLDNPTPHEIPYDRFSFTVQCGETLYPMSLADASGVMPPKSKSYAFFSITGTPNGYRNNLSPDNEFLIGLTTKTMENQLAAQSLASKTSSAAVQSQPNATPAKSEYDAEALKEWAKKHVMKEGQK